MTSLASRGFLPVLAALVLTGPESRGDTGCFSDFCFFLGDPPVSGYYGDGFVFDGPFRANGPVCLWSSSPSSTNDVWFYSFTIASPYYIYGTSAPGIQATEPQIGNLTIQPIELMVQGPPWFVLGADPIPFHPDSTDWQSTRLAAMEDGLYFPPGGLPGNTRMILAGDTLLVKTMNVAPVQTFLLGALPSGVVWIDNEPSDRIYLKGFPGDSLTALVTIGMNGSLYMYGSLSHASSPGQGGMLGLVSVMGDIVIAHDPDCTGGADWADPLWRIVTDGDFSFSASMIALDGDLRAQNWQYPQPVADLVLSGSIQILHEGYTAWGTIGGYSILYSYDWRLQEMQPPWYPRYDQTGTGGGCSSEIEPGLLLSVSENPFRTVTVVTADGPGGALPFRVFDSAGRLLSEETTRVLHLDGSCLPPGVYIVTAGAGPGASAVRLVRLPY